MRKLAMLISFSLLLLCDPLSVLAQDTKMANPQAEIFKVTSKEIKQEIPGISTATLNCDQRVIRSTLPVLKDKFKSGGLTEADTVTASAEAWLYVRFNSPLEINKCMDQLSFQEFVISLGKLSFATTPDQANVEVNGTHLNKKTAFSRWYPPGTYKVKYFKTGFKQAEKDCTVSEGEQTDCSVQLQPQP